MFSMADLALGWGLGSFNLVPISLALLVAFIVLLITAWMRRGAGQHLPPSPPGLPIIGHLHLLGRHKPLHQILTDMAQKFGPIISLRLGTVSTLIVSTPKLVEECLKDNDKIFSGRPHLTLITHLTYDGQDVAMARRMTPEWRQLKKVSVVELHNHKRLVATRGIREAEVAFMLNGILHDCTYDSSTPILLREKIYRTNFNIISMIALKRRYIGGDCNQVADHQPDPCKESGPDFEQTIREAFVVAGMICLQDCFPIVKYFKQEDCVRRMNQVHSILDTFFQTIIDEHKEKRAQMKEKLSDPDKDMVDVLLDAGELTELQIKATLMNAYIGATESLILPMEWILTEAMRNPKVMERATAELDQVVGRDRMCTEADVPNLHYIRAMVTESMRLHPAAPLLMPRETTSDCRIAGYDVPVNTRVLINMYAIGRDPANWDDPLQFNPERFLDLDGRSRADSDVITGTDDFKMLPFGAGRRMCPGINMGMAIVYLTIASLLHSFTWSVTSSDVLDLAEGLSLSNPKCVPLRALARPRLAPAVFSTVPAASAAA